MISVLEIKERLVLANAANGQRERRPLTRVNLWQILQGLYTFNPDLRIFSRVSKRCV